jgi:hypothetical protein
VFPGSSPGAYFCRGRNSGRENRPRRPCHKKNASCCAPGTPAPMRNRLDLERLKNRAAEKLSRPSPRLLHFPRKCATRPPVQGAAPAAVPPAAMYLGHPHPRILQRLHPRRAPAKSVLPTKNELSLSDALQPSALPPEFSPRGMF